MITSWSRRDDRPDRHLPFEAEADVQHDRGEHDDQSASGPSCEISRPHVGPTSCWLMSPGIDPGLVGERREQRLRLRRRSAVSVDVRISTVSPFAICTSESSWPFSLRTSVTSWTVTASVNVYWSCAPPSKSIERLRLPRDEPDQRQHDHDSREPNHRLRCSMMRKFGIVCPRYVSIACWRFTRTPRDRREASDRLMLHAGHAALQSEAAERDEPRTPRDQEHGRALEEVHDEQVEQRRDTERQREPAHRTDRGQVQHDRGDPRDDVGRDDRAVRALERGLDGGAARVLPCRTSSFSRSKNTMYESAVTPSEITRPAMPASVSAYPNAMLRERDQREREDRPDRHAEPRHDAEQPVVEEQVQEEQHQTDHPGDHALLQRLLAERGAHRQGLELLELHREGAGVQDGGQVLAPAAR